MPPSTSQLQRELKQSRPFSSLDQEGLLGLFRTADLLRRQVAQLFAGHDVTHQQYNVLRILRGAGGELHTLAIAERMVELAPGITRLLDRLEQRGLVERQRLTTDRRCVVCRLTSAGNTLLAELEAPVQAFDSSCLGMLPAADKKKLIRLLDRIRTANDQPKGE